MFLIALKQKAEKQIFNLHPPNVAEPARPSNEKTEQQIFATTVSNLFAEIVRKTMSIVHVIKTFVARLLVMFNCH